MPTGSCLCNAVRFEISAPYKWVAHCHCSMCRKHHGSLYATTVGLDHKNFRWLQGAEAIVHYRTSAAFERPFCRHCGSAVPDDSGDNVVCPAGTLDTDFDTKPTAHIFVASKSPMYEISDSLHQFAEYPPGLGSAVAAPPVTPSSDGVHGSCLCGDVAFVIDETPRRMANCHCSRCRRSRGAAHATNVFAPMDKLRWTRGAEKVRTYKVPEARAYGTAFCERCGSLLPAAFERIGQYLVPVGVLDSALPVKPGANIYVDSKAPWFDITDSLPQFPELPPRERLAEFMFDLPARP